MLILTFINDEPTTLRFCTLASEIVTRIESGEWTASEVLEAYIARAAFAHSRTNCLTEGGRLSLLGVKITPTTLFYGCSHARTSQTTCQ